MLLHLLLLIHVALAHTPDLPSSPAAIELKWSFDPTILILILSAYFYSRGLKAYGGKVPRKLWQKSAFLLGIIILAAANLPPIDSFADQLFSVHMLQHLLITALGIPLLLLGAPFLTVVKGCPVQLRKHLVIPFLQSHFFRVSKRFLGQPLMAVCLYEGVFWFWHIPYFYNRALLNDAIHFFEHGCMAFAALNLWRILIDAPPMQSKVKIPVRILILGLLTTMDMALSAALTYSSRVWYVYDRLPMPAWWKWNRLQDQELGGVLMWVPGGFVWVIAMGILFALWIQRENPDLEAEILKTG